MTSGRGTLRVGTSGWAYRHWTMFYPRKLPGARWLEHYSGEFDTVEVNTSFYHLPLPSTYVKWASETEPDFLFALKLSRYITHIKKLSAVRLPLRRFLRGARGLGTKLGPLLVQLPPNWKADAKRLGLFLEAAASVAERVGIERLRMAFEFRHETWFRDPEVHGAMEKHGAAIVFGHSTRYPYPEDEPRTAAWVYLRFHGPAALFGSKYGTRGLKPWAAKTRAWLAEGSDVYAYFNNDARGYAIEDARALRALAGEK